MFERRAGCGKAACPVLGGAGVQLVYGRDIVAPSGNQTETENTNFTPEALEDPSLLDKYSAQFQLTILPLATFPKNIVPRQFSNSTSLSKAHSRFLRSLHSMLLFEMKIVL
jgi:hypothetical protein